MDDLKDILKSEFISQFKNKYAIVNDMELGEGHYAFVFLCKDIQIGTDLAVKVFFEGVPPDGAKRGWHITSSIIHNQIAPTLTVEPFYSKKLKRECYAVIQRHVPGKSMRKVNQDFNDIELEPSFQFVLNDFALTYVNSLLEIITFCHSSNIGHGDLHDGNIIVFQEYHPTKHSFRAVLIDFENSSFKDSIVSKTELEKIESDIGLFRYFFTQTFYQWKYYEPIIVMFREYNKMAEFKLGYSIVTKFIDLILNNKTSKNDILNLLAKLPHPMMGFHIPYTVNCLRSVAELDGLTNNLQEAIDTYNQRMQDPNSWKMDVTIEYIQPGVTDIYKRIFK